MIIVKVLSARLNFFSVVLFNFAPSLTINGKQILLFRYTLTITLGSECKIINKSKYTQDTLNLNCY